MKKFNSDTVFDIINYTFVTLLFVLILYPVIYVCSASVSDGDALISGKVRLFPVGFNLEAYKLVFEYPGILRGYLNTIFYTFAGTFISVCLTVMAAYPLSRKDLPGRGFIMFLFTFTMLSNGGLIPTLYLWCCLCPAPSLPLTAFSMGLVYGTTIIMRWYICKIGNCILFKLT